MAKDTKKAKKITKITDAQRARFPEWSEKWMKIGLSTERADFDAAEVAVLKAYEMCGLKPPKVVLRVGSPYSATLGGVLAWSMMTKMPEAFAASEKKVKSGLSAAIQGKINDAAREVPSAIAELPIDNGAIAAAHRAILDGLTARAGTLRNTSFSMASVENGHLIGNNITNDVASEVTSPVEGSMTSDPMSSPILNAILTGLEAAINNPELAKKLGSNVRMAASSSPEMAVSDDIAATADFNLRRSVYGGVTPQLATVWEEIRRGLERALDGLSRNARSSVDGVVSRVVEPHDDRDIEAPVVTEVMDNVPGPGGVYEGAEDAIVLAISDALSDIAESLHHSALSRYGSSSNAPLSGSVSSELGDDVDRFVAADVGHMKRDVDVNDNAVFFAIKVGIESMVNGISARIASPIPGNTAYIVNPSVDVPPDVSREVDFSLADLDDVDAALEGIEAALNEVIASLSTKVKIVSATDVETDVYDYVERAVWKQICTSLPSNILGDVSAKLPEDGPPANLIYAIRQGISNEDITKRPELVKNVADYVANIIVQAIAKGLADTARSGGHPGTKVSQMIESEFRQDTSGVFDGGSVYNNVRAPVGRVLNPIANAVSGELRKTAWPHAVDNMRHAVYNYRGGALWASWGAYVSFMRYVLGWDGETLDRFAVDEAIIKSCGWVWWHEDVVAIGDRPNYIGRDEEGRLHNETGPSMSWTDGWALYHWHGVVVPDEWVLKPETLTAEVALKQQNMELRRVAITKLGWAAILRDLKARVIDQDDDPAVGTLLEVELPDIGKARFLRVRCGTGREFAMGIPNTIRTALGAQAWMVGLDTKTFKKPEVRT